MIWVYLSRVTVSLSNPTSFVLLAPDAYCLTLPLSLSSIFAHSSVQDPRCYGHDHIISRGENLP